LDELEPHIRRMAESTWEGYRRERERIARTVVLKLKTREFRVLTRSLTQASPPASADELAATACALRARVNLPDDTRYRLVGVGLSGLVARDLAMAQHELFDPPATGSDPPGSVATAT